MGPGTLDSISSIASIIPDVGEGGDGGLGTGTYIYIYIYTFMYIHYIVTCVTHIEAKLPESQAEEEDLDALMDQAIWTLGFTTFLRPL